MYSANEKMLVIVDDYPTADALSEAISSITRMKVSR